MSEKETRAIYIPHQEKVDGIWAQEDKPFFDKLREHKAQVEVDMSRMLEVLANKDPKNFHLQALTLDVTEHSHSSEGGMTVDQVLASVDVTLMLR